MHNPAYEVLVRLADLTIRNALKRSSAPLEVVHHPDDKFHYIFVGDFLVLDRKRAEDFDLSPQNGKLIIIEWISWDVFGVKDVEVPAIYETD